MGKRSKQKFRFNTTFFIRLLIFFTLFFVSITLISRHTPNLNDKSNILGTKASEFINQIDYQEIINSVYQKIPPKSREKLENLNQLPLYLTIEQKIQPVLSQLEGFPDKQIKEIKKEIVNRIYQDIIKSIENN